MSAEADGELRGWRALYVRFHARICPPCRRVKRSLDETMTALHDLRDETAEAEPKSR
jgi:hypothetical protein